MVYTACMSRTIPVDDELVTRLDRLRGHRPLRQVAGEALRAGLEVLEGGSPGVRPYRIEPVQGQPRRTDLDNVQALLAEIEGNTRR